MNPTWQSPDGQVKLWNADCLDVMPTLPAGSVDMVMADLPYQVTQNKWDSMIPLERLWPAYAHACKPTAAICLTASQPFTSVLTCSNLAMFKYAWVWEKSAATGHLNAKRMPMKSHEDVLVFGHRIAYNPQGLQPFGKIVRRGHNGTNYADSGKENFQEFTNYPRSVIRFDSEPSPIHPTQKPVALMEYLIRTYTNEGDTVMDNTFGSGTTGVACVRLNRRFIGIEKDTENGYFQKAKERIEAEMVPPQPEVQSSLFATTD